MADTFLRPVIQKLVDLLIDEAKSLKGVHKQVKSLQKELEIIEPLLRDAEAKSASGQVSAAAKVWLRQLREEADRIEDVVDEYTYYAEQRHGDHVGLAGSLRKVGLGVKALKTRHDFASEIHDVKESLREIKERGVSYGLRPFEQGGSSSGGEGSNSRVDPRIGSLFVDDDELVGIESISEELMRSLVEGPSARTVVSFVGEGGIGKTTLARKVYNNVVDKGCFDHHVWVTVSQSFDIDKILKMLMNEICPSGRETVSIEESFTLLRRSLQGKRYVIVFDDVWQTDFWCDIQHALPSNNSNGSRILVTTRKPCFVHHVWVTVSQSYDIDNILKMLVDKICPSGREIIAIEESFGLLRGSLQGKRYVIVFDDVWQTDFWSVINHALPSNNSNGSRILVTTRKSTVVESFKSASVEMIVKELKTWSTEQAWELFCKKAFACSERELCCPPELEELSHEILSKCQGLPLAIVALAGLLSKKDKSKVEWQSVLDNLNYEFGENRELSSVSKVLLLSYHDLPYHLKSCFLYFGIFPEDFSIDGERLCKIWIAEGFIKLREDKTFEQIAEEYLIELINRNLVSFELQYGTDRLCKVHDLIHDLILTRTRDLGFCPIINQNSRKEKGRRWIIRDTTENVLKGVGDSKTRSVFLFEVDDVTNSFVVGLFESCKLLKVVDFEDAPLDNLPKEVGNLLHLRYLNLSYTKVKTLPKSIGKLRNLQAFDVCNTLVRELPVEINKLHKLRHLLTYNFDEQIEYRVESYIGVRMHEGIGSLEELQTLSRVEAHSSRANFIKELQNLKKLKRLGISKLTTEMGKALGESLEKMNDLEILHLCSINQDEVLDLTCISSPPLLLRYLRLSCRLRQLPIWVSVHHNLQGVELNFSRLVDDPLKCLKGLPKLAFLRMCKAYDGEELRFEEGGFLKLKHLVLRNLEGLKVVKIERGALPLLEKLDIGPSPLMKELPCNIQHLTSFKSLRIFDMPMEFVKALQPNGGSEYCKIQHIPFVTFSFYKGRGIQYDSYKLGSSELFQHLEHQQH